METAAAAAPEAPAISTVLALVVVAATPKINPKMETVPSSMPNTIVPAELMIERRICCHVEPIVMMFAPSPRCGHARIYRDIGPRSKAKCDERCPTPAHAPDGLRRRGPRAPRYTAF